VIAILAAAACALAAPSCWVPPYDPAISASVLFEEKLERVASLGPFEYDGVGSGSDYFVPSYRSAPTDGFWVRRTDSDRLEVRYVGYASGSPVIGAAFSSESNRWGDLNAVKGMSEENVGYDLSTTMRNGVHVWGCGEIASGATSADAMVGLGLATDYSLTNKTSSTASGFTTRMIPIGGSAQAFDNGAYVGINRNLLMSGYSGTLYVLAVSGPHAQYDSYSYTSQIPAIWGNTLAYGGSEFLPGTFFVEYYDGGTYDLVVGTTTAGKEVVGLKWDATNRDAEPTRVIFPYQITDALNDNTLVARGKTKTSFYDVAGTFLFSLPTGSIRFIHEYEDGSVFYSYFSRTVDIHYSGDDSSGTIRFDVYRYPSASLSDLAD